MKPRLAFLALLAGALWAACSETAAPVASGLGVAQALGGGDPTGFARVDGVPDLRFPRDHGSHPEFRTEWWYVTGNVATADGRRFGVQLVFFRQALAPSAAPRSASLAAREVLMAHAAVTDVDGRTFHHAERLARLAGGLGEVVGPAPGQPFRLVCADWSALADAGGDGFLPLQLQARDRDFAFTLQASAGKPMVLQGDRGWSRKSGEPGNASCYYSMTRVPLQGTITVGGEPLAVAGLGWIDREWGTSALGKEQVGWDWFSLQLANGEDLMWYQLRQVDGNVSPWSRGVLVAADGTVTPLHPDGVAALPIGSWTAPDRGATYPAQWRLRTADDAFVLEVVPVLPDQELHTLVRYWEGAVEVRGMRSGRPVAGRGYLEMTGYTAR